MILQEDIFQIQNEAGFREKALSLFRMQAENTQVYKEFITYLKVKPSRVQILEEIPYMPVELFKSHKIIHKDHNARLVFESSGTTGINKSRHFVAFQCVYDNSLLKGFRHFYGEPDRFAILALLPSYLENKNSSLVYMVNRLIKESKNIDSGFYLNNYNELIEKIIRLKKTNQKVILFGVTFALLELAEKYRPDLSGLIVMETGGMKGRRNEITREEVHSILKAGLNVDDVHSEYGMTELLSQAYSFANGIFQCPPWMKIMIRDPYDPATIIKEGRTGAINIIDMANLYSCSFLATSDLGKIIPEKGFEVAGRIDHSDIRGCNLLVA